MCLYLESRKQSAIIATEEFKVYKVLQKDNRSEFQNYLYEPNQLSHRVNLVISNNMFDGPHIRKGYHSYVSFKVAYTFCPKDHKIVEFTIPKGAKYYLGNYEDIVSNRIMSGDLKGISLFQYYCKKIYNYVFV